MWGDGQMSVVHSVGYPDQSLSHFEGIDVWASARTDDGRTGWTAEAVARLGLDGAAPPSVQIGASYPLLLRGPGDVGGMTLINPDLLDRVVSTGTLYDTDGVPETPYGRQLEHIRRTANDADTYGRVAPTGRRRRRERGRVSRYQVRALARRRRPGSSRGV